MAAAIKRGIKENLWISVQDGIETGRGSFPPEVTPTFPASYPAIIRTNVLTVSPWTIIEKITTP
jgi:hypothetical protein